MQLFKRLIINIYSYREDYTEQKIYSSTILKYSVIEYFKSRFCI